MKKLRLVIKTPANDQETLYTTTNVKVEGVAPLDKLHLGYEAMKALEDGKMTFKLPTQLAYKVEKGVVKVWQKPAKQQAEETVKISVRIPRALLQFNKSHHKTLTDYVKAALEYYKV